MQRHTLFSEFSKTFALLPHDYDTIVTYRLLFHRDKLEFSEFQTDKKSLLGFEEPHLMNTLFLVVAKTCQQNIAFN